MPLKPHQILLYYFWRIRYIVAVVGLVALGYVAGFSAGQASAPAAVAAKEAKYRQHIEQLATLLRVYSDVLTVQVTNKTSTGSFKGEPE